METLKIICQALIGLGILNVWLLRFNKSTSYRGGSATSLKEEFVSYGLPAWSVWPIGALKVGSALVLLTGIFVAAPVKPAAIVIALLMAGAVIMHIKVTDPPKKMLPATVMLLLSLVVIFV